MKQRIGQYLISFYEAVPVLAQMFREAQNAESKADFIHKFKIADKKAEETEYWLELCHLSENYPDCQNLLNHIKEIQKILNKIISTSKLKIIG